MSDQTLRVDKREPLNDADLEMAKRYGELLERDKTGHPEWDAVIETAGKLMQLMHADLIALRLSATADAEQIKLLKAKLLELAGDCAECAGSGRVMTSRGAIESVPCPDCLDIRELLS